MAKLLGDASSSVGVRWVVKLEVDGWLSWRDMGG